MSLEFRTKTNETRRGTRGRPRPSALALSNLAATLGYQPIIRICVGLIRQPPDCIVPLRRVA